METSKPVTSTDSTVSGMCFSQVTGGLDSEAAWLRWKAKQKRHKKLFLDTHYGKLPIPWKLRPLYI